MRKESHLEIMVMRKEPHLENHKILFNVNNLYLIKPKNSGQCS